MIAANSEENIDIKKVPTLHQARSVLEMNNIEAREFFLKQESYCNFDLPRCFEFEGLLKILSKNLEGKEIASICKYKPRNFDDINHTILHNKDGKLAWRPLQLIHPVIYVKLVHKITEDRHWKAIKNRFSFFLKNPKISCLSIPVESVINSKDNSFEIDRQRYISPTQSKVKQKDKAQQINKWWQKIEQKSVELSLEYQFLAHTDISDCYSSIYTHSIAWALHKRSVMKKNQKNNSFLGNSIDNFIQDMSYAQTNGIPQGSVLMDFIAEMVLGYADSILTAKLWKAKILNYQILRYRDDYRIFTNSKSDGEKILKAISETMHCLGMKLNPLKTGISNEVIRNSFKIDKVEWILQGRVQGGLQKRLLIIHDFSQKHPNSGTIDRLLLDFLKRLENDKRIIMNDTFPMIAIAVDIAANNPRTYTVVSAIISRLLLSIVKNDREGIIRKIQKRFELVANTGSLQIWLQVISHEYDKTISYSEPLCQIAEGRNPVIWNNSWVSDEGVKKILEKNKILNEAVLKEMKGIITHDEIKVFENKSPRIG
jgi:hypothetical protein